MAARDRVPSRSISVSASTGVLKFVSSLTASPPPLTLPTRILGGSTRAGPDWNHDDLIRRLAAGRRSPIERFGSHARRALSFGCSSVRPDAARSPAEAGGFPARLWPERVVARSRRQR